MGNNVTLKSIFAKRVDRPIEGVIKADDEGSLLLEFEEYVLTNEIEKRLEAFLEAYNNYQGANGVWISGFFGSGKSHLLKILALLLENRLIDNIHVFDTFISKCGDNELLRGDLKRAIAIPSQSILFNIDQKADIISKTQVDALLAVFVKVFDEACGYYGKQPYIAQFERELDRDNLLQKFKDSFSEISSHDWEWGRIRSKRVASDIDKAYEMATGQQVSNILDKYDRSYKLSIEDFAEQINAYINQQEKDFRLNFFVDEVGQYVADNVKLMTNLQTVAESLATKCKGRAWVIVTAQEDMNTVVGERSKQQSNDFSKIQARFKCRMKLTGADVAEVIKKRLLMKNKDGNGILSGIYDTQKNNFKTLFDFADGSQTYKNFQDQDDFAKTYPFIPYQFTMFQTAIQNLSQHNAFEGKHTSVGERSMLGVFQQVAIHIGDYKIGQLATFDLMFEGIRTALKAQIQSSISVAEKNLDDEFAVRLLKTLFLVKYIKGFKATIRNLSVLMLEYFDQNQPELKKKVEKSLKLLVIQSYIQRNGDLYSYLTDEERDIETEIKNTDVESKEVTDELAKIIFDQVIKNRKIRYDDNSQDYPFTRKLDDNLQGREYELAIHVVTPFHENSENMSLLHSQSLGRDELLVIMPSDERFVRDILMYKRAEKYIRQNISITQQKSITDILRSKGSQNHDLYLEIEQRTRTLLGKARLFVGGTEIEIGGEDAQTRIIKGFNELIGRAYSNLRMLRGHTYSENDIGKFLKSTEPNVFSDNLPESEQEVVAFIQSNNQTGVRTTLKNLIEHFERKPYGWYFAAILCTIAKLSARGKLDLTSDSNPLDNTELEKALRNTRIHGDIVIRPQIDFTPSQVRSLKEFFGNFFDAPPKSGEAKSLGQETGEAFQKMIDDDLKPLLSRSDQYPFQSQLSTAIDQLKEISGKSYTWYLTELKQQADDLLDIKEKTLDPIRKFMSGSQKEIFDSVTKFIQTQSPNFSYLGNDAKELQDKISNVNCLEGNNIQQLKASLSSLEQEVTAKVQEEIASAKKMADSLQKQLEEMSDFAKLADAHKKDLIESFQQFNKSIECQTVIAVILDLKRTFEESEYRSLLSRMSELASKQDSGSSKTKKPPVVYVSSKDVHIPFAKKILMDEADVERYVEALRKALIEEIKTGKRIQI
ncbi:MAG: BREX system P-loop protein BrxC [candidate division Zixibacteria bacterium]|nr:BREX system P-loop protein BrxC [candidate division Zixibacteria bacterium]